MISSSREADFASKNSKEGGENNTVDHHHHGKNPKTALPSTSTTTSSWSKLKDPRIVRVSRAFGGKDRHSKVCTVRGLRDRRVRLSVPTAIQLYDLQEKLGLNQPSKVVDWLLNAAKDEIDELPPLQMPPGNFSLISHDAVQAAVAQSQKEALNINKSVDWDDPLGIPRPDFWNPESMKSKDVEMERVQEGNWKETRDEEDGDNNDGDHHQSVASTSNFFPRSNHDVSASSVPGLLNNVAPYNPFYRYNSPMNFSLGSHGFSTTHHHHTEQDHLHNLNVFQLQPRSQALIFPSGMTAQPYFPAPNSLDHHHQYDTKQIKQFQMLGSNSENPFLPFQLSMAPSLIARPDHHDQNGGGGGDHHRNHSSNN